jgi:hypothetical protein
MSQTNKFNKIRDFLAKIINTIKGNRLLGTILTILSIIYPIILISLSWTEIKKIETINPTIILSSAILYIISTFIQMLNWILILKGQFIKIHSDMRIYFKTLLMQRLPGGFWQWVGRINLYNNNDDQSFSSNQTLHASIYERITLIASGLICYLFINNRWAGIIALIIISFLLIFWRKSQYEKIWKRISLPLIQIFSYIICWIIGGYILSIIINFVIQPQTYLIEQAIPVWSLTGIIGLIFFFLPGGLGIRELSLTTLLAPELTFSQSILVSLLLRVLFLAMDIIIGLGGGLILKILPAHPYREKS